MTAVHHPPAKSERAAASVQPIHAPLNSSLPSTFLNLGPRFPGGRAQDANARLVVSYCVPVGGGRVRIGSAVLAGRQSGVSFRSWQRLLRHPSVQVESRAFQWPSALPGGDDGPALYSRVSQSLRPLRRRRVLV